MLQRRVGHPGGCGGGGAAKVGALAELPPPWGEGFLEDLVLSAPSFSSCEERGGPLPIQVAVAGP